MSNNTPWWDTDEPKKQETPWWDNDQPAEEPAYYQTQDAAPQTPHRLNHSDVWTRVMTWVSQNLHTVIYMAIGLCLAIGILKIGFWRTFLIALCLGGGYILGSWHDGNPYIIRRFQRFSRRFLDDNPFMNKRN